MDDVQSNASTSSGFCSDRNTRTAQKRKKRGKSPKVVKCAANPPKALKAENTCSSKNLTRNARKSTSNLFSTDNFSNLENLPSRINIKTEFISKFTEFWQENALSDFSIDQLISEHFLFYYAFKPSSGIYYRVRQQQNHTEDINATYLKLTTSSKNKLIERIRDFEKEEVFSENASSNELPLSDSNLSGSDFERIDFDTQKYIENNYQEYLANLCYTPLLHKSKTLDFVPSYYAKVDKTESVNLIDYILRTESQNSNRIYFCITNRHGRGTSLALKRDLSLPIETTVENCYKPQNLKSYLKFQCSNNY